MARNEHEPVRLHPDNPHYFLFRGRPAILITSAEQYGAVVNLDFDYTAEWIDPEQGHLLRREQIGRSGRLVHLESPPYTVDVALRIRRRP